MAYTPQIYYPSNYQPQYQQNFQPMQQQAMAPQPMPSNPQPAPQNNQGLIWVSGEVGAKSYLMAPNSTVMLMDSESETFYLKSTDTAGMPLPLRIFDYKERTQNVPQGSQTDSKSLSEQFVTREEYNALSSKYEELLNRVAELQKPKTNSRKKEEVESNE